MFSCSCGKTFAKRGWAEQHAKRAGSGHTISEGRPASDPAAKLGDGPQVLDVKLAVRVNGKEMTLSQFVSMVNRLAILRDTLKHLGLD